MCTRHSFVSDALKLISHHLSGYGCGPVAHDARLPGWVWCRPEYPLGLIACTRGLLVGMAAPTMGPGSTRTPYASSERGVVARTARPSNSTSAPNAALLSSSPTHATHTPPHHVPGSGGPLEVCHVGATSTSRRPLAAQCASPPAQQRHCTRFHTSTAHGRAAKWATGVWMIGRRLRRSNSVVHTSRLYNVRGYGARRASSSQSSDLPSTPHGFHPRVAYLLPCVRHWDSCSPALPRSQPPSIPA